jgi:hypothetical protein
MARPNYALFPHSQTLQEHPSKTHLYHQAVPDAPPHAGAASVGTDRLRRPKGSFYCYTEGETLT